MDIGLIEPITLVIALFIGAMLGASWWMALIYAVIASQTFEFDNWAMCTAIFLVGILIRSGFHAASDKG